jgi:RNA polymerase sigma-70 factor (ECF subfamily)
VGSTLRDLNLKYPGVSEQQRADLSQVGELRQREAEGDFFLRACVFPVGISGLPAVIISMGLIMPGSRNDPSEQLSRIAGGDSVAVAELFAVYRDRLRLMVRLRLDRRQQGRLDPSDVLQEAYPDVARRAPKYAASPTMPPYLWLRFLTGQRLLQRHRQHLGARMRDAGRQVSPRRGDFPQASSESLAELLLGRFTTPSRAAVRAETQARVQEALSAMDPVDREVLVLRHFEMLGNEETAQVLGLKPSAASNRHVRALRRLKEILADATGSDESSPGP